MPFNETNAALGLPANSAFKVGKSNFDTTPNAEEGITIPCATDPKATWIFYDCTVGVMLDSGIVVHNRLPQINRTADTLASCDIDAANIDALKGGVNLKCMDQYTDIMQRMGHARYWFRLWGQALRFRHQVPIPGIKSIGGVPAIPYDKNPQWAFNRIFPGGNFGGVILWHAVWSLWYCTLVPPNSNSIPAVDVAAQISGRATQPDSIQVPTTSPDDDATSTPPPTGQVFGRIKK